MFSPSFLFHSICFVTAVFFLVYLMFSSFLHFLKIFSLSPFFLLFCLVSNFCFVSVLIVCLLFFWFRLVFCVSSVLFCFVFLVGDITYPHTFTFLHSTQSTCAYAPDLHFVETTISSHGSRTESFHFFFFCLPIVFPMFSPFFIDLVSSESFESCFLFFVFFWFLFFFSARFFYFLIVLHVLLCVYPCFILFLVPLVVLYCVSRCSMLFLSLFRIVLRHLFCSVHGSRKQSLHTVAEFVALSASRNHGGDATAERQQGWRQQQQQQMEVIRQKQVQLHLQAQQPQGATPTATAGMEKQFQRQQLNMKGPSKRLWKVKTSGKIPTAPCVFVKRTKAATMRYGCISHLPTLVVITHRRTNMTSAYTSKKDPLRSNSTKQEAGHTENKATIRTLLRSSI